MRHVRIQWLDACSLQTEGRWSTLDACRDLAPDPITSTGFVIADEPSHITIAAHIGETHAGGEICIPRGMVVSIHDIGDGA